MISGERKCLSPMPDGSFGVADPDGLIEDGVVVVLGSGFVSGGW